MCCTASASHIFANRVLNETVAGQMPFGISTKPGQCEATCGQDCSAGHIQAEDAILDERSDRNSEYQDFTA